MNSIDFIWYITIGLINGDADNTLILLNKILIWVFFYLFMFFIYPELISDEGTEKSEKKDKKLHIQ